MATREGDNEIQIKWSRDTDTVSDRHRKENARDNRGSDRERPREINLQRGRARVREPKIYIYVPSELQIYIYIYRDP